LEPPGSTKVAARNADGGNSEAAESTAGKSPVAQTADRFREAAAVLRQARGEPKENLAGGQRMEAHPRGRPMPGEPDAKSEPGEAGGSAAGVDAAPDLSHLDAELQQQARQNWGRLPGKLRTEILQGAGKKSHPEYTRRIKSYFDEITKPAK
jgi:hypothetical protein